MSKKIVYYDTNIWAAYMLGPNDRFYSVCEPLIDNVINGQNLAIVPYLVIMETIYVLRNSVVKDRSDGDNTTTLTNKAKKHVDKFIVTGQVMPRI